MPKKLQNLDFDNSYCALPGNFYSRVHPEPLQNARLAAFNRSAAQLLDLAEEADEDPDFVRYFNGEVYLPGSDPIATVYAGHQFGYYVPQLGDGRAILLGEVKNAKGERWDLQLKGAGLTPYSREGDGRAVLRSVIREYLCSEAMHGLGIPTSRALAILDSGQKVYRERIERGAMLVRLAQSHVRFGSFELFFYRGQKQEIGILADYVIKQHFPHIDPNDPQRYLHFFDEIVARTARLMAQWQAVGFAHGVMNTDNMSILGLTLDYGPFGFLDSYNPEFICNHSDMAGRYAFDQQPDVAHWNLACLAQALTPLLPMESLQSSLFRFPSIFASHYLNRMTAKLGIASPQAEHAGLVHALLEMLKQNSLDYTRFFRRLATFDSAEGAQNSHLRDQFIDREQFDLWARSYRAVLLQQDMPDTIRAEAMNRVNPKYILRNYLAQIAIGKAEEAQDYSEIDRLLQILSAPFDEQPQFEEYASQPPDWAAHIQVSCSS